MMDLYSLITIVKRFEKESIWLEHEFHKLLALAQTKNNYKSLSLNADMCIIRLYDSWCRFNRRLIIWSASGKSRTLSGNYLSCNIKSIQSHNHVISFLLKNLYNKPRKIEPNWGYSRDCIDAAKRLKASNYSIIASALGSSNSPANDLRFIRNFLAHRGAKTAIIIRGMFNAASYEQLSTIKLMSNTVLGGNIIFNDWIKRLRIIARAAAQ